MIQLHTRAPAQHLPEPATDRIETGLGNAPARLFQALRSLWDFDPTHDQIEVLAAELAARAGRARGSLCLGLMPREAVPRLYGLVFLLDGYGLILRQRHRERRDAVFVYIDVKGDAASEYAGARVRVRRTPAALPAAA